MSTRRVVLSGTLKINSVTFGALGGYEQYIQQALVNSGFSVNAVRLDASAFNLANDLVAVTLDLNVDTVYTAEQARQNALAVIEAIPSDSYIFWGSPQFSNIDLGIVSDGTAATATGDQTRGGILDVVGLNEGIQNITGLSTTTIVWIAAALLLAPYIIDTFSRSSRRR